MLLLALTACSGAPGSPSVTPAESPDPQPGLSASGVVESLVIEP